jgi:hypothetical protein
MVSDDVACHATKKLSTTGTQGDCTVQIPMDYHHLVTPPPFFYEFLCARSFRMVS